MAFPFVRQHNDKQCGAACLAMICRAYGANVSLRAIDNLCTAAKDGVSMLAIANTAKKLGLSNYTFCINTDKLMQIDSPCILHWDLNHFVVLYRYKNGKFYIADPNRGKYVLKKEEMPHHSSSPQSDKWFVMLLEPTPNFQSITSEYTEENHKNLFHRLKQYTDKSLKCLLIILLGILVGALLQIIFPFLTKSIVDIGVKYHNLNYIKMVLIGGLAVVIARTINDFIRRWLLLHLSMRLNLLMISDYIIKVLRLPISFFDSKTMGDLMQRIDDHERIKQLFSDKLLGLSFSLISLTIFGVVLLIFNTSIFLIYVVSTVLYGLWIMCFLTRRKALDYELFDLKSKENSTTYQLFYNIQEIKVQGCQRRRRFEWEENQANLYQTQIKLLKLQQTREAGAIFINEIKNIFITFLSAALVINGSITLGTMLAIQYIIGQLNSPIERIMDFIYFLQDVRISFDRIDDIHLTPDESSAHSIAPLLPNRVQDIVLNNVNFKYDSNSDVYTLSNINFTIPAGKVTAIVGASGSGKSTLIKLLLGFYNPCDGQLLIGGNDLHSFDIDHWRSLCGVVMQDGAIFSDTIELNIAISDDNPDSGKVTEAAKVANIHDYIDSLPLKYKTTIGNDGINLSQGQKQRILIARAIYKDPKFIFLDEATNSLDASNEIEIVHRLNDFFVNRTVVVVAHRLSTVKNADQIIVLENGKVAEIGNHKSLTSSKGIYYSLIKNQLELDQ